MADKMKEKGKRREEKKLLTPVYRQLPLPIEIKKGFSKAKWVEVCILKKSISISTFRKQF